MVKKWRIGDRPDFSDLRDKSLNIIKDSHVLHIQRQRHALAITLDHHRHIGAIHVDTSPPLLELGGYLKKCRQWQ